MIQGSTAPSGVPRLCRLMCGRLCLSVDLNSGKIPGLGPNWEA